MTISGYKGHFRQLVSDTIDPDDVIIGGQGVVVQVDETKLGRRKYNRGHRVEGAWVIVGVEKTARRAVFAEVVEDRSESTIVDVLSRHLEVGSIIYTDCWRGYTNISRIFRIEHKQVNHSRWFKDPETGVETNTVEGTNYAIKRQIQPRNRVRQGLEGHLNEFVWRRKNENTIWNSFIEALRDVYYQ